MLTQSDKDLVLELAGCSLAEKPGNDNWVDEQGGLPEAICEMARALKRDGKSTGQAIAIAVSQAKKLAAKGKAKYVKAVAQWESMKAKSHSKNEKAAMSNESSLDKVMLAASRFKDTKKEVDRLHGVAEDEGLDVAKKKKAKDKEEDGEGTPEEEAKDKAEGDSEESEDTGKPFGKKKAQPFGKKKVAATAEESSVEKLLRLSGRQPS